MPELQGPPVPGKWEIGLTDAELAERLANKQARRPASLHDYGIGAARRWHLSWVKNSGPDFEDWGWTAGESPDVLDKQVAGHDRQGRRDACTDQTQQFGLVAHQRGHLVPAIECKTQDAAAAVAGRAQQENSHS